MSQPETSLTELSYGVPVVPEGVDVSIVMIASYDPKALSTAKNEAILAGALADAKAYRDDRYCQLVADRLASLEEIHAESASRRKENASHYTAELQGIAAKWLNNGTAPPARLLDDILEAMQETETPDDEVVKRYTDPVEAELSQGLDEASLSWQQAELLKDQTELALTIDKQQRHLGRPARIAMTVAGMLLAGGAVAGFISNSAAESDERARQTMKELVNEQGDEADASFEDSSDIERQFSIGMVSVMAAIEGGAAGYFASKRPAAHLARLRAKRMVGVSRRKS